MNLNAGLLSASPSTKGILTIPLIRTSRSRATARLPSKNTDKTPDPKKTVSNSLVVYTNSGEAVKLDIYYTKDRRRDEHLGSRRLRQPQGQHDRDEPSLPYGGAGAVTAADGLLKTSTSSSTTPRTIR